MATKVKTFVVEGSGEFPTDMLRYDACWPSGQEDVIAIEARFTQSTIPKRRRVRLCYVDGLGGVKPTAARWDSFNWRVVEDGLQKAERI